MPGLKLKVTLNHLHFMLFSRYLGSSELIYYSENYQLILSTTFPSRRRKRTLCPHPHIKKAIFSLQATVVFFSCHVLGYSKKSSSMRNIKTHHSKTPQQCIAHNYKCRGRRNICILSHSNFLEWRRSLTLLLQKLL